MLKLCIIGGLNHYPFILKLLNNPNYDITIIDSLETKYKNYYYQSLQSMCSIYLDINNIRNYMKIIQPQLLINFYENINLYDLYESVRLECSFCKIILGIFPDILYNLENVVYINNNIYEIISDYYFKQFNIITIINKIYHLYDLNINENYGIIKTLLSFCDSKSKNKDLIIYGKNIYIDFIHYDDFIYNFIELINNYKNFTENNSIEFGTGNTISIDKIISISKNLIKSNNNNIIQLFNNNNIIEIKADIEKNKKLISNYKIKYDIKYLLESILIKKRLE